MKMPKIFPFVCGAILAAAFSCSTEILPDSLSESAGDRVPVTLSLDVAALEDGTPETKTMQDPDIDGVTSNSQIANVVVLQFNGTASNAPLVGGQVYFDHWPLIGDEKLTLVASGEEQTVVVLANTFGRLSLISGLTLGTFLEQDYTTIATLSSVYTTSAGDDFFRMSGTKYLNGITAGTSISVSLKRNVAKIIVNVQNTSYGANKVNLSKVHLRDINGKYYYLTNIGSGLHSSVAFSDVYDNSFPHRFDDEQLDFPAEKNPDGASPGTVEQYVYYVPANLRGTTNNITQYSKGLGAPLGATRLCIYGTYGSGTPIHYTYYLGGNLTNDFNIQANHKYTYNITISEKGDSNYDYRIEDLKEYEFQADANCYMLHPSDVAGESRVYSFPIRRAAVFWNQEEDGGIYGANNAEGYTNYVLIGSTSWTADILWSDFDMTGYLDGPDRFLQTSSGTGFDPDNPNHTQPYIKVKVPSGMRGNVLVAVRVSGTILWSWHLWITDYNPDVHMTPVEHRYIYGVKNGDIHRYNNAAFTTEPTNNTFGFSDGFVMDRNLGADNVAQYGCYYEYGRKDPFNGKAVFASYHNGTEWARYSAVNKANTGAAGEKNIRYTVNNPMTYITGDVWTAHDDDMGGNTNANVIFWRDNLFFNHTGDQDRLELKKSIYDPCPAGWKVLTQPAASGLTPVNDSNRESETYTYFDHTYYPEGYVNREATGGISFPMNGICWNGSGEPGSRGNIGYIWFNRIPSANSTVCAAWYFYSGVIQNQIQQASGVGVRCCREYQPRID